ncbi:MAG: aminotransferase [Paracoccaceae bacterium]
MTIPAPNPMLARVFAPPVMAARRWLDETPLPAGRALLNLSQAAPVDPPPESLRRAMADALTGTAEAHLYGPVLGDTGLRARIAADWSRIYGGRVAPDQVAVTAGCNQAFCVAVSTLAGPGDAVILPVPWYFNHKMWLDMAGIEAVPLPVSDALLPDPEAARALIGPRTRAIALVSPNNPTGVEYPDTLLHAFLDLAAEHGIGLILDETYRDFHSGDGAPHTLFARPDWADRFLHLYSFSKVFRLTGHRTGALIAGAGLLAEAEKFLDTVTICPPRTGQIAALAGLETLAQWVAGERAEVLARRRAVEEAFARLPGWRLLGAGAYFAYAAHPFAEPSDRIARALLAEEALLVLPGTMFMPEGTGADGRPLGAEALRIAFANADADGISEMGRRLAAFTARRS